ncbi:EamA family transporter [Kocuria sp. M1N1S27]|uniref:EamA family transporter n=1 Tax=Kocuria kalidii TaxID=3376283 RepID=UPI003794BA2E
MFIKIAVEGLSPGQVVLGRLLGGAVLLALIMTVTRRRWPTGTRTWSHFFALGILMCVAPFLLFAWAAQHLPSGRPASSTRPPRSRRWSSLWPSCPRSVSPGSRRQRWSSLPGDRPRPRAVATPGGPAGRAPPGPIGMLGRHDLLRAGIHLHPAFLPDPQL